jgi:hypothetical protein
MSSPIKGCAFSSSFSQGDRLRHELYIDTGDGDRNLELFEYLHDRKEQIEKLYLKALSWDELPHRRACRIAEYRENSSVMDVDNFEEFIKWFIDAGIRLRGALSSITPPPPPT